MKHYYINISTEEDQELEYAPLYDLYEIPDIMGHVFSFLPSRDLFSVGLTCRQWRILTDMDMIWKPRYEILLRDRYYMQENRNIDHSFKHQYFTLSRRIERFDYHHENIKQLSYEEKRVFPFIFSICRSSLLVESTLFAILIFLQGPAAFTISITFSKFCITLFRTFLLFMLGIFLLYGIISKNRQYHLICETGIMVASNTASFEVLKKELLLITPFFEWLMSNILVAIGILLAIMRFISWRSLGICYYSSIACSIIFLVLWGCANRTQFPNDRRLGLIYSIWSWLHVFMGLQFMSIVDHMTNVQDQPWMKVFGELYSITYICLMVFMNITCRVRFNWKRLSTNFFVMAGMEVMISWILQFMWSEKSEDGWRNFDTFIISSLIMHFFNSVTSFFMASFFKMRNLL